MDCKENRTRICNIITIAVVLLISALALYFRFKMYHTRDLAGDELVQIDWMKSSLLDCISKARIRLQFPGDYALIYPFYKIFGLNNKWGLAIPHIGATLLGLYLLYELCRKYFKTIFGYIVTFAIVAFNATLIIHAFEIRPYSVLVTLGIAAFLVMKYIVEHQTASARKKDLVVFFIFLCVTFHFYGIFMLFFSYMYHLICSRKKELFKETLFRNVKDYWRIVFILFPFLYYFALEPDISYMEENTFEFIHRGVIPIAKGIVGNLMGYRKFYFLLLGLIISFIIPNNEKFKQVALFVIAIACPILLILWLCVINHYWFIQRLFIWVVPLFAFLIGWCWDSIFYYLQHRKV